ncbi:hypothetical protein KC19_9G171900 [Ceratodon purpureus]|uniref:Uncharacterized protein n=1 Tax=Ceratodon purpureus TaxID=3225 RepID=A0A8T0GYH5_CERPU|nr:hypothetical protein KC19_9G171900 [Ceratodon purpureus]
MGDYTHRRMVRGVCCDEVCDARILTNCSVLESSISEGCLFVWSLECKFGSPVISRCGSSDLWRVQCCQLPNAFELRH